MDQEMRKRKESAEDGSTGPSSKRLCAEMDVLSAAHTLMCFQSTEIPKGKNSMEEDGVQDPEDSEEGYEGDEDYSDDDMEEAVQSLEDSEKEKLRELLWKIPLSDFICERDEASDSTIKLQVRTARPGGGRKLYFLALHFLCAVRKTMLVLWHSVDGLQGPQPVTDQENPSFSLSEIVEKLMSLHHDDHHIVGSADEPLQLPLETLTRGALHTLSFKPRGKIYGPWMPLTSKNGLTGRWSWVGPKVMLSDWHHHPIHLKNGHLAWGVSKSVVNHFIKSFEEWLEVEHRHVAALATLETTAVSAKAAHDMVGFIMGLRAKCGMRFTVPSSLPGVRARFQEEERLRYTVPERAFYYTAVDGERTAVAPVFAIRRTIPRKSGSRLREDRPKGVSVVSVVKDAVARLPGGRGTTRDVCTLVMDSQYLIPGMDVNDAGLWPMVANALNRMRWAADGDPAVQFVKAAGQGCGVWRYLHRTRRVDEF